MDNASVSREYFLVNYVKSSLKFGHNMVIVTPCIVIIVAGREVERAEGEWNLPRSAVGVKI